MRERKVITAEPDSLNTYLNKIWMHRTLIITFAKRDLKIKYAQTFLGLAWTIIQPTIAILIYTLFFNYIIKVPTGKTPYILFVLSGLTLWSLFSYIFNQGSYALLSNQEIIKKMAFPKIILPISKMVVALTEFGVSFVLLVIAWCIWSREVDWRVILMPLPLIGIILLGVSVTLLLLSVSIKRRDLLHVAPFVMYFGIWFTPVFYPVSLIPDEFKEYIYLNPVAAMIDFFRWTISVQDDFSQFFILSFFVILVMFFVSLYVFKNVEDKIIDMI